MPCLYGCPISGWSGLLRARPLSRRPLTQIRESPTRLPIKFAGSLYEAGESGMGGRVFTVLFSGWMQMRQVYRTGNLVDFIPLPGEKTVNDIIRVYPHEGRDAVNFLGGSNSIGVYTAAGNRMQFLGGTKPMPNNLAAANPRVRAIPSCSNILAPLATERQNR